MKIWHFSDTHGNHRSLQPLNKVDVAIFSGDAGTYRDKFKNEAHVRDFIEWFGALNIPIKIMIAGNHDSSIEHTVVAKADIREAGIYYLENENIVIDGYNIWGSPYTPTFGDWSFMKSRNKIHQVWDMIPDNTDVLVTHGPPKGILDITENPDRTLEMCGCANLYKQVTQRIKPKYHLFGHIHDRYRSEYKNASTMQIANCDTVFSNGSVCKDGQMNKTFNNGKVLAI